MIVYEKSCRGEKPETLNFKFRLRQHIPLELGQLILAEEADILHPEQQGIPVDERDDLKRDEGKTEEITQQPRIRQLFSLSGQRTDKKAPVLLVIVDTYIQFFSG
jgi:hypothetical protein